MFYVSFMYLLCKSFRSGTVRQISQLLSGFLKHVESGGRLEGSERVREGWRGFEECAAL